MFSKLKIKTKIIIGFLVIAIIIVVFGGYGINRSKTLLKEEIGKNSVTIAKEIIKRIDGIINSRIEDLLIYQKDSVLKEYLNGTGKKEEDGGNKLNEELESRKDVLEEEYGFSIFKEIAVVNKVGKIVGSSGGNIPVSNEDLKDFIKGEEKIRVSNVSYSDNGELESLEIDLKIFNEDNEFAGVIIGTLGSEEIIETIGRLGEVVGKDRNMSDKAVIKLLSNDGRIIYDTQGEGIGRKIDKKELLKIIQERRSGYFETDDKKLVAHAHSKGYKNFKSLGWVITIEYDEAIVFGEVNRFERDLYMILLLVTAIILTIGLIEANRTSGALKRLQSAAEGIAKGDLKTRLSVAGGDEITKLAESIEKMRKSIARLIVEKEKEKKEYAIKRLKKITPILEKIALGDFSQEIQVPEKEDEFTEHLTALKLMLDDLREMISEIKIKSKKLQSAKEHLEEKVKERTKELNDKLYEVEKFNKVAVNRELKMVELKKEIKELRKILNEKR